MESMEQSMKNEISFYKDKRVFVTGHTGFKGAWLCKVLIDAGAIVTGYALKPPTNPSLFELAKIENDMTSVIGDIRDYQSLADALNRAEPEIVFHLAAQPLVRESYANPVYTYETNVMGTVNILECVRRSRFVRSVLNVTTDKVYFNREWEWGYRENDELNGYDPYSNSKSCSELVTHSYKRSFLDGMNIAVSTARAGNVIGGGDFARDRIIPDCIRAVQSGNVIAVRNPYSVRPYQHVLEPIYAYLLIAAGQYNDGRLSGSYNVGPDDCDCVTTGELADLFCRKWGEGASWRDVSEKDAPHEAGFLKLDCSKIKRMMNWAPRWHIDEAVEKTVEWSKSCRAGEDLGEKTREQIREYLNQAAMAKMGRERKNDQKI